MELKKYVRVDHYRKRPLFLSLGLLISVSLSVAAFQIKTPVVKKDLTFDREDDPVNLYITPQTEHDEPKRPEPPKPQKKEIKPQDLKNIVEASKDEIENEIFDDEDWEEPIPDDPVDVFIPIEDDEDQIFIIVEDRAKPADGFKAFYKFLGKNIKYPTQARRLGVEGRVFVSFVVERDGSLSDIKVLRGIGAGCDEEALRVLGIAPKWKPGKQRGRPVRVQMQLPIVFSLGS